MCSLCVSLISGFVYEHFRVRLAKLRVGCRIYDITLMTYLLAFGHFSSELIIFRTATLNPGVISPVIVSSEHIPENSPAYKGKQSSDSLFLKTLATSLVWMIAQYDFYVRS